MNYISINLPLKQKKVVRVFKVKVSNMKEKRQSKETNSKMTTNRTSEDTRTLGEVEKNQTLDIIREIINTKIKNIK